MKKFFLKTAIKFTLALTLFLASQSSISQTITVANSTAGALTTYTFEYTTTQPCNGNILLVAFPDFVGFLTVPNSPIPVADYDFYINNQPVNKASLSMTSAWNNWTGIQIQYAGVTVPAGSNIKFVFRNVIQNATTPGTHTINFKTADFRGGAIDQYYANVVITSNIPSITAASPTQGQTGSTVTLTGTNFIGATAVKFNGVNATSFTVNSATSITAVVPQAATTGTITVETPNGTATGNSFTVDTTNYLINPTTDGGFEGAHGWTVLNTSNVNKWVIGGAQKTLGNNGAFISDNGTTNTVTNPQATNSKIYIYKDVVVPLNASAISLSFKYKNSGNDDPKPRCLFALANSFPPLPTNGNQYIVGAEMATYLSNAINWTTYTNNSPLSSDRLVTYTSEDLIPGETYRVVFEWSAANQTTFRQTSPITKYPTGIDIQSTPQFYTPGGYIDHTVVDNGDGSNFNIEWSVDNGAQIVSGQGTRNMRMFVPLGTTGTVWTYVRYTAPTPTYASNGTTSGPLAIDEVAMTFSAIPKITSISPLSGAVGSTVTLTGNYFGASPANNVVYLGGVKCTITAATNSSITVNVPTNASFNNFSVLNTSTNLSCISSDKFVPTNTALSGLSYNSNSLTSFESPVTFTTGTLATSPDQKFVLADVDTDGKVDIFSYSTAGFPQILKNNGTSGIVDTTTFLANTSISNVSQTPVGGYSPKGVLTTDFNNDGKLDFAMSNSANNGGFANINNTNSSTPSLQNFNSLLSSTGAYQVNAAFLPIDINLDGRTDIFGLNGTNATQALLYFTKNTTTGSTFSSITGNTANTNSYNQKLNDTNFYSGASGDIDGDGKTDVVLSGTGKVYVLKNTTEQGNPEVKSFSFSEPVSKPIASGIGYTVKLADLDLDGKLDVITTNSTSGQISVFKNNSTATNLSIMDAQHFTLTGITATYGLALADMNGDGKPDVVVSDNATNSKIAYLENTSVSGAITFASSVTLYSAMAVAYPQLEIADIDGDNKPDIIAANNTNGIVVFRNRAAEAGKISADQTICSGVTPSSLTSLTPATFTTGGTITYKWQSSTNGTSWTDITSSNTLGYTIPSGLTVTTYYRRAATNATTYYFTNPIVITVTPNPTITANVPATACGTSTVTLSATSSGGVVKWYSASTGGTLLGTGSSFTTPSIATTTTYYAQAESANGCISSAARTAVAATIVTTAPVIQSTTTAARCDSGSVTLTATLSAATTYGATLNWYATATGGTAVGTGTSFVTPSMSATTIYYVEATNCNGTSARTSVTASVINTPSIVNTLPNAGCRNTNVVLSATSTSGSSLNWYSVASAGSAAVGNATVYGITANTTRYVAAYITSAGITCESPRTEVVATMYNLPAAATAVNTTLCGLGTATVSVTTASNTSIKWYDTANAGTLLGTGLSYVTPVIAANTSYFAAVTDANGCNATTRTKVDVVYNGPTVSILNNLNAITNTANNTITATIANQTSYIWQRSIDGGTNWTDITANLDPNVTYSGFSGTTGTTTTLTISKAIPFMHLYKYRLKVTKSVGCDNYSNVATLNVADIFGSCDYSPFASPVNQSYSNRENTWVHYEYDGYGGNYNYFERHGYDSSLGSLNDNNQNSGLIVVPNSTDYSYITIDLGTSKVIDKAYLQGFKTWSPSGTYYSSNYPETYYDIYYDPYETYYGGEMNSENADGADILVSNDQVNWTTVYSDIQGTFYDSFNNQSGYTTVSFPPISARYVKVARNTWGYLGLSEFQVFPVDTGNAPYIRFAPQAVNYVSTGSTFPINVDVTANGNSTLSYQWKKSNNNVSFTNLTNSGTISGVTTNKLGISSFAAGNIGYYKLDVNQSNWCYVSTTVETRLVAPYYTSAAGATAMQTLSSWNTNSTGTGGSAPANFTTATNVFILSNSANSTYNAGTNYSNAGNLRLNGNKFTLGNYNATWGSVLESSATAYVKTNGSGQLINTNTSTTPVIFPVGNSSYNPLTITNNTGTTDTFAVSVSDGVWDGGTNGNGTAMNNVINRTWKVTKTTANSGGYGVDLTFGWTASDISGLVVDPILYAFVPGTGWVAQSVGSISRTATTVTFTKYTGALNSTLFMLSNAAPVITSFSPVNTGTGNSVVIKGTGLSNASTVSFGGVAATSYVVNSATQITAVVGIGASGSVSVTTPGGTAILAGFTFVPAPTITSFTPYKSNSGTTVTITGTNFNAASSVTFGGTAAINYTVVSNTVITAVLGTGTSGNVAVTTPGGTATASGFVYGLPYASIDVLAGWNVTNTATQTYPFAASYKQASLVNTAVLNSTASASSSSDMQWTNSNSSAILDVASAPYISFALTTLADVKLDRFVIPGLNKTTSKIQLRWSVDNYASSLGEISSGNGTDLLSSIDLSSTVTQSAGTIQFRAYFYNGTNDLISMKSGNSFISIDGTANSYNSNYAVAFYGATKPSPTLGTIANISKVTTDPTFALPLPSSNSNGIVTYISSDPSIVSINGTMAVINGPGIATIIATQSASNNYSSGGTTFTITVKTTPTIYLPNYSVTVGDGTITLNAESNSSGAITYSSGTTSVATIIGNTLTIVGAGTSVITINQAASGNFTAATNTAIITVGAANLAYPTLSNFANINKMMSNPAFSLIAPTSNSAGTYTYYSSNASVATISGSTVTLIAPGISIITAIQAANGIYRSSSISAVLTVGIGANTNPVITNFTPISKYVTDIPFVITSPTSTSSAPFSYFSSLPNVGIINGSTTTIKGLGVSNITAIQPASGLYNAGSITNTLSVINAPPVINYNSPNILTKSAAINAIAPVLTGGVVSSYSIVPSLPVGLLFNTSTGVISGTPIVVSTPVTYTVTATNATGNGSTSFIIEVKDVAPSTLSYTTPNTYSVGTTISTLFPTNSGGTITNYTISPTLPGGLILNSTTGTISGTPSLALATTQFTITGTNTGGSVTTNITITVTDAAPTSLEYSTPNVLFKGVLINSLTPSYSGGAIVSYAISPSLPAGLTFNTSTGAITGRPSVPSASTNYTIIGTNSGGTVSKTISILVNDNEPTDLSYPTPNIFQVGAVITPLTPTIYGGVATRYSIDRPLPTGLNFNTTTGVISGTPTQITANTTYIVTAFNLMGRSNTTLDITIGGPASNLSYGGNLMLARNVIMTTVNPTINSNTSVTYSVSPALPAGLVFDTTTGQIFGMPTTSQSAQSYTVTANNGFAPNATVTFTIAVVDVPSISYVTPSNYTAGVAISNLIPTVSGLTPITFSIAPSLPSGMLFDTTTGVISGTPTSYTPMANYTITATNAVGSTPVTIPITVNKRIPTIGSLSIGNKTYGDANFDIVNPSTNSSGTFSYVSSNTAVATISGNTVSITGAGSATITANLASDADYDIGTTTATLTVNKAIPTIGSIASITKAFGDAAFNLTAPTSNSTGAFSYASSDSNVVSINGTTVSIVGAGTATITASQAGDANYDPGSVTTTITVNKAVATLSAMPAVTKNFGDASFNLVAPTSASTGAITYVSNNTNVATISGNTVTIIGAGTATITAIQATDANYLGATTSTTLTVNKIAPTLGAMTTISKVFGDANFTITPPSTNSTGAFTYTSSDTNVATISGAVVSIVGAGTATISVDQATDSNYLAAATSVSLAVNKAPVVFGTTTAITKNYGDADFILTPPQTNSTGTFTYSSNNPSIATINGNLVTIHGIGTTTITVNQATTTNYLSGSTTISLVVNKTLPTIGSIASITKTFGDAAFNLTAPTSNSTGSFSYASSDSNVVSIIGNTVTIVGAGTATITAAQAGDANYDSRSVTTTITVNKAVATLSAMTGVTKNFGDPNFNIVVPTSAGTGVITFVSSNSNVATISGNTVTIIGAGTATITAIQATDANYLGATTSTTLTVNKIAPTLGAMTTISKVFGDANFTITPPSTNSTGAFTYTSSDTNVATISGAVVSIVGAGTATISVDQATDSNYLAAATSVSLAVNKAPVVFGTTTAITKNYGDADFILTPPQTNSTGTFTYSSNNPSIATINGNLVTIHGIGTTTITVNQATTTNYLSGSTTISLVVNKTLPTIGSIASITKTFGDAAFNLTAPTSNSSGSFSYASSDSNVVSIIGNTVTIVGAGTATITAAQAGDANYDPRSVTTTITINKALPVLTVMTPITKVYGDASFGINLPTSSSTAGVILASSNTNVATISGNTISIIGVGTATITATQVANTNYLGTTTSTTLTVNKNTPVLSNFNAISKTTDDAPFTLIAPTSSGGTGLITYSSSNPSVATISGNMVTITGSGSTLITATKEGDTNYNVQSISAQLTVGVGSTQTPILVSPLTNTTGATTLQISYSLPESPLPGSVKLIFTPSSGGSSIIWNMNNTTFATFAYPVGTNPTLVSNVISGVALAFTTYNITISYQDVFASPVASSTNTNIQTLAPPRLSTSQINYSGIINNVITPIVITNSGGLIDSFTINPALPLGLVINPTTGVITGKPSVLLSTTNYTITATNAAGTGTINISLFIDGDMDKDDIGNLTDPDTDGDGVSNAQEVVDGTDPNNACSSKPSSITLPLSRSFLDGDCDSDGLTNEKEIGSNVKVPKDEDNNGIPDYLELNNHEISEDDLEIFNSMTVNGDDLNDVFVIRGIEQYPNNTVIIYNRWGVEVYNVEGYGQDNKFFRGISEGRVTVSQSAELPKGTYFYILRYVNKQGIEKERSGYLYITK